MRIESHSEEGELVENKHNNNNRLHAFLMQNILPSAFDRTGFRYDDSRPFVEECECVGTSAAESIVCWGSLTSSGGRRTRCAGSPFLASAGASSAFFCEKRNK